MQGQNLKKQKQNLKQISGWKGESGRRNVSQYPSEIGLLRDPADRKTTSTEVETATQHECLCSVHTHAPEIAPTNLNVVKHVNEGLLPPADSLAALIQVLDSECKG